MTRIALILIVVAGTLLGASLTAGAATPAFPVIPAACAGGQGGDCAVFEVAQAGCAAVAARTAQQMGGQVIGAPRQVERGGRPYCQFTLLVPDQGGQRPPQRQQVEVPM